MRAGSQLAGGGSGLVGPQAAVNFGCPASCGGTHPSEFRHKNGAPCFRAGQARGSSCKLSSFDFTSAPVYCHVCFWRPAPQCAAWCCMPNVGIQHQVAPKNGTPALQCTNWGHMPTFLAKPYLWVASHTPSWVGWSACWIALQVLSHASGGTHIAQPCPSLRLGTWKLDASHWDVRAGVGPHWPAEHTPRLWHAPFGARCPGLLSACSHMQVRAPTAQDLPPH